jgi:voltage-gated potassium channel
MSQVGRVQLPSEEAAPLRRLAQRMAAAVGIIVFVALVAYLGRGGYADAGDGEGDGTLTLLDCLYYATVSVTTTGYGDIRPESDGARLATTLLVTPARIGFLVLLVGTTVEVLAERSRHAYRVHLWRRRLRDHTIICGFGTKGRAAAATLLSDGIPRERIVVIDADPEAVEVASDRGLAVVHGTSTSTEVLDRAGVRDARSVVVATHDDATSVLVTLTARELNRSAQIVAAVREEENAHLLREGGADQVIISSGSAGRLLGLATISPRVVHVLEDLLSVGEGLDIVEREVADDEVGPRSELRVVDPVMAVVRGDDVMRFDDPDAQELRRGDRLVILCSRRD